MCAAILKELAELSTCVVRFPCGLAGNQDAAAQNGKNGQRAATIAKRRLAPSTRLPRISNEHPSQV
jgi:hypothetical protein